MSTRDIGWIDKDKISDTLRSLKDRQRTRRPRTSPSESGEQDTYIDLLGEQKPTALASPADEPDSGLLLPDPHTSTASIPDKFAPSAAPETSTPDTGGRSNTPTAKLVTTPNTSDEYTQPNEQDIPPRGEPRIPGARPIQSHAPASTAYPRDTTTLETTPTRAQEPDQPDLALRFQDALDVLRSADEHRLQDRFPTAEIHPTQETSGDLSLNAPEPSPVQSQARIPDLALRATGEDNTATPKADEDLHLVATDAASPAPTTNHDAFEEDDEPFSLPAHDLDLSIHPSAPRVSTYDDSPDTQDLSDVLVFESEDFADDASSTADSTFSATLQIPDPNQEPVAPSDTRIPTDGNPTGPGATDVPEHTYVPKIHSQILKTVRLRTAPDPAHSDTLYEWFQALHTWIQNTEAPSTQFLVADRSGLSLLDTGVDEYTVAIAATTRKSISDLKDSNHKNSSGTSVVRHANDRYLNLIWAPSPHGIITLGMVSDEIYPDERLASFEEKLVRAIASMPFI